MQNNLPQMVYVLDKDGKPLMPTQRYGRVRRLLKSGKAVIHDHVPFTIQLTYEPETKITQPITLGIDPGRANIGLAATTESEKCIYMSHVSTRNKKIPCIMRKKHLYRRTSRRGECLARKRLAKKHGTRIQNADNAISRILPKCKKAIVCKDIINTEARFANHRRPSGWLTPTATHLLHTHINMVKRVAEILPITDIAMETNKFVFMALEDPTIWKHKKDFQNGPLKGYNGVHEAVKVMQQDKCLLCGKEHIEHYHHIEPLSKGGSDTIANTAGVHNRCHDKIHKDAAAAEKLLENHEGLHKKYGAASVLNQIIISLARELDSMYTDHVQIVSPKVTKTTRIACNLDKDHTLDAYSIAFSTLKNTKESIAYTAHIKPYEITQQRRHNRANIDHQNERIYKVGKDVVATNRHKRMSQDDNAAKKKDKGQTTDSLEEWRNKQYASFFAESIESGENMFSADNIATKKPDK